MVVKLVDAIIWPEHGLRDVLMIRSGAEIRVRKSIAFPRRPGLFTGFLECWILTGLFSSFLNGAEAWVAVLRGAFSAAASFGAIS